MPTEITLFKYFTPLKKAVIIIFGLIILTIAIINQFFYHIVLSFAIVLLAPIYFALFIWFLEQAHNMKKKLQTGSKSA